MRNHLGPCSNRPAVGALAYTGHFEIRHAAEVRPSRDSCSQRTCTPACCTGALERSDAATCCTRHEVAAGEGHAAGLEFGFGVLRTVFWDTLVSQLTLAAVREGKMRAHLHVKLPDPAHHLEDPLPLPPSHLQHTVKPRYEYVQSNLDISMWSITLKALLLLK